MTEPQLTALKLASVEPIRYYNGGWYTTPAVAGEDQTTKRTMMRKPNVTLSTLRACVARGWMTAEGQESRLFHYAKRWPITDLGRKELAARTR